MHNLYITIYSKKKKKEDVINFNKEMEISAFERSGVFRVRKQR